MREERQHDSTRTIPYLLEDGEGESIRWFGDTITVKNAGPTFDVAVITAVAGSEPPLHVHQGADEALFVLEGELTVYAADHSLTAGAGAFFFLPKGIPHAFVVESGSARLLMIVAPPGVLAMFSDVEERVGPREMPARPRPADIAAVAQQLEKHGVRLARPNPRHPEPKGDRRHA
jgi:quercetin dioxygenase-like cupin family protein